MHTPSISVVIPAFNAERTIRRAIDSILVQQRPADEIIVVDDGSDVPLQDLLRPYGSAVTVLRQPNAHAAAARNRGIDHARGDWIALLDADDFWEPEKLQQQVAIINQHPELGLIAGRYFFQPPDGIRHLSPNRKRRWYDRVIRTRGASAFLMGTLIWTGTVMVKRSALADERFVSGLEPAEDRDLWVRLASKVPVWLMSRPLATAVMEPDGISRGDIGYDCTQMMKVIDRHRDQLGLPARFVWQSYVRYRWAAIESSPRPALNMLLRSFAIWPAPYVGLPAMQPLGRVRRLLTLLRNQRPSTCSDQRRAAA